MKSSFLTANRLRPSDGTNNEEDVSAANCNIIALVKEQSKDGQGRDFTDDSSKRIGSIEHETTKKISVEV